MHIIIRDYYDLIVVLLCQMCFKCQEIINESCSQGNFPQMENIAAYKPISASPSRFTCGLPERSSYCQTARSHNELVTCYQAFCFQDCPYRSSTPPFAPLLLRSHRFLMCKTSMQTLNNHKDSRRLLITMDALNAFTDI